MGVKPKGQAIRDRTLRPQARSRELRWLAVAFVLATFFDNYTISELRFADNLSTLVGLTLLVVYLAQRGIRVSGPPRARGWFIAFLGVTAALETARYFVLGSAEGALSFRLYLQFAQVVVLYLIFVDISRDPRVIRSVGVTFVGAVLAMSVLVNLGILGGATIYGRAGVERIDLNMQSFLYALGFVFVFWLLLSRWPRLRAVDLGLALGAGSMLVAAARTGSRGGAASLLAGVAIAAALSFSQKRLSAWIIAVPLGFAGIAFGLMSSEVLRGRAEATITRGDTGYRAEISRAGWELVQENPVIGSGAGYFRELGSILGWGRRVAAHNAFLQILIAFGLLGFLPWFIGLGTTVIGAWRARSGPWGPLLLGLMATTLCFSLVSNLSTVKQFWIVLAVLANAGVLADVTLPIRRPHRGHSSRMPRRLGIGPRPTGPTQASVNRRSSTSVVETLLPGAPSPGA